MDKNLLDVQAERVVEISYCRNMEREVFCLILLSVTSKKHQCASSHLQMTKKKKRERKVSTLENRVAIQRDLDRLDLWSNTKPLIFSKYKGQVLYLGMRISLHQYRLGIDCLGSSSFGLGH